MKLHKWDDVARSRVGAAKLSELAAQARAEVALDRNLPELRKVR